ncbi:PREDICTED: uncharacterized protein LOC108567748 [Nicrophorus vespilloides]|uniref:Uncharacterized protein LOC108567748 n=1 Tax=Nicrophorus vespilloides TaxID=110193 RepID=A0ABM1NAN0_NICVS|nr:PREDICTED: uncharacterized protein LOC108567748 [Nicrophorus vespilloides]
MKHCGATLFLAFVACTTIAQMQEFENLCPPRGFCLGHCKFGGCVKRAARQDDMGPFWANRGKREPSYFKDTFYADEPRWLLMRRDEPEEIDPFFTARGKKHEEEDARLKVKKYIVLDESPFMAARGKKTFQ